MRYDKMTGCSPDFDIIEISSVSTEAPSGSKAKFPKLFFVFGAYSNLIMAEAGRHGNKLL
jgi:hypothetical protein